ncbi:hypothetical protein AB0425_17280 [Actinosynnema sp. NPDC051121]
MTTTTTDLDFEVRDSTIVRTVRLTQGHVDRGQLPVPPAIREQLAAGESIVVTLYFNPGFRQMGVWSTEQVRAALTGITWPADITPGTRADVSVQWSDGHTRRVAVIVDAPEPTLTRHRRRTRAAAKPRAARQATAAPVVAAVQQSEIVSRDIVATAQVHGGTRVIEFSVIRHTFGGRTWSTYRVAAYDSNHRHAHNLMGSGPADTQPQIEEARGDAQSLLTPSPDPRYCDCWSGWDRYCGKTGCWGVYSR